MFRKAILSAVLGTGLVTGLALTPSTAEAHPPVRYGRHHEVEVLYRCGFRWELYGDYYNRAAANRAAESLRRRGYAVEVRPC
jgi:hypothetical protein